MLLIRLVVVICGITETIQNVPAQNKPTSFTVIITIINVIADLAAICFNFSPPLQNKSEVQNNYKNGKIYQLLYFKRKPTSFTDLIFGSHYYMTTTVINKASVLIKKKKTTRVQEGFTFDSISQLSYLFVYVFFILSSPSATSPTF